MGNLKSKEKDAIEQVNGFEINKDKDNSSQAVIDLDSSRSGALGLKDVLNQQVGEPQTVETKDISKSDILITDKTEEIKEQNPKEGSSTEIKSDKPVEENVKTETSKEGPVHVDNK